MRDYNLNVNLIELIQKNPRLYDNSYEEAWQKISDEINQPVYFCKTRWGDIRRSYLKYIKKKSVCSESEEEHLREYYLTKKLGFLDKFLQSRSLNYDIPVQTTQSETTHNCQKGDEAFESLSPVSTKEDKLSSIGPPVSFKPKSAETQRNSSRSSTSSRKSNEKEANKAKGLYYGDKKTQKLNCRNITEDADLSFFESVLPEMQLMSSEQKRQFKIGIISLCGQILDSSVSNTMTPVSSSTTSTGSSRELKAGNKYVLPLDSPISIVSEQPTDEDIDNAT